MVLQPPSQQHLLRVPNWPAGTRNNNQQCRFLRISSQLNVLQWGPNSWNPSIKDRTYNPVAYHPMCNWWVWKVLIVCLAMPIYCIGLAGCCIGLFASWLRFYPPCFLHLVPYLLPPLICHRSSMVSWNFSVTEASISLLPMHCHRELLHLVLNIHTTNCGRQDHIWVDVHSSCDSTQ